MDTDAAALAVGVELTRARAEMRGEDDAATAVAVRPKTIAGAVVAPRGERFDLVLLGQVLSELDAGLAPAARVEAHAALVRKLLADATRPDGSLVVIEPALRERTRHLHAVRDALLAGGAAGVSVFAPCLHAHACPALASESDWCHEDLPVDLPDWLAPIARAAGLRWQGLTFSYLVLRRDGATLAARGFPWRVVSGPIVTKGKRELFLCGAIDDAHAARLRVQRLDRHAGDANRAWEDLDRGDRVKMSPPLALPVLPAGGGGALAGLAGKVAKVIDETSVDVDRPRE